MRRYVLPILVFVLLSIWYSWPVLRHPTQNLADGYDGAFSTWVMNWSGISALHYPSRFYHAPIFFPYNFSTTFSDPMLSSGLLALPFVVITGEPLVAQTVIIVLTLFFLAFGTYVFIEHSTKDSWCGYAAGMLAAFGSMHMRFLGNLPTFFIPAIPWGLFSWQMFVKTSREKWLWILAGCFLIQALNSPLSGFFFLTSLLIFAFDKKTGKAFRTHGKDIIKIAGISFALVLLFYCPYIYAAVQYHAVRTIRDAAHFALSVDEIFRISRGFTATGIYVLIVSLAPFFIMKKAKSTSPLALSACFLSIVTLILALGPVLKWDGSTVKTPFLLPLPYAALYVVVPGFQAFRDPSRWIVLTFFLSTLSAGLIVNKKCGRLFLLGACSLLLLEKGRNYPVTTLPSWNNRPAVYRWLQEQPVSSALFLPPYLYASPETAVEETRRMLWTLPIQRQPLWIYNGYSGFAPQERVDEIVRFATLFPNEETINALQKLSPEVIVIEKTFQRQDREEAILSSGYQKAYEDARVMGYLKRGIPDR